MSIDFQLKAEPVEDVEITGEVESVGALDLSDPTATLGPVAPDRVVVRFRKERAARMLARRLGSGRGSRVTWEKKSADFLPGELPNEIDSLRPFGTGIEKARRIAKRDKVLSAIRSKRGGVPKKVIETISHRLAQSSHPRGPQGLFFAKIAKDADPREVAVRLMQHRDVVYAHPSPVCRIQTPPNDPLYDRMWHLNRIGMELAWSIAGNLPQGVRVCVIDTGVRLSHIDLAGRIADPKDVYPDNGDAYADTDPENDDVNGHGTKCAGVIGAVRDNGETIAGVAPVTIIPVNGHSGENNINNYTDGVYWGVDHGAKVINMSFGASRSAPLASELDAAAYAEAHDVLVCAAAGNDDTDADRNYPSAIPYYIAVGAVDDNDVRVRKPTWHWGSNFGDAIDVCAPGQGDVGIYRDSILTLDSDFDTDWIRSFNGTSSATPHVTGLCALLAHVNPLLSGSEIRGIIESTAQDQIGDPAEDILGWDPYHGHGLINAGEAVLAAAETTTQAFTISNHGCSELLTITAIDKEHDAPWLSVEPASPIDIEPGAEKQIVVRIDPSGLVAGSYTDRLLIYSNDLEKSPYPDGVYIHLTVTCDLPLIIEEPSDLVVDEGQDATFSITAASDEPISYVWTVNGMIVGDDSPNLNMDNVGEEENGSAIACEVVNPCGSLFSRTAILTVVDTCPPDFDDDGDVDGLDLVSEGSGTGDVELFDFAAQFGYLECLGD